jgi:hypothetical protein
MHGMGTASLVLTVRCRGPVCLAWAEDTYSCESKCAMEDGRGVLTKGDGVACAVLANSLVTHAHVLSFSSVATCDISVKAAG